jgi:hypothetical protein
MHSQTNSKGLTELAGTRAEESLVFNATAGPHEIDAIDWLKRANEHRTGRTSWLGDNIEHGVDTV